MPALPESISSEFLKTSMDMLKFLDVEIPFRAVPFTLFERNKNIRNNQISDDARYFLHLHEPENATLVGQPQNAENKTLQTLNTYEIHTIAWGNDSSRPFVQNHEIFQGLPVTTDYSGFATFHATPFNPNLEGEIFISHVPAPLQMPETFIRSSNGQCHLSTDSKEELLERFVAARQKVLEGIYGAIQEKDNDDNSPHFPTPPSDGPQ